MQIYTFKWLLKVYIIFFFSSFFPAKEIRRLVPPDLSMSKKSGWSWAFSDRYGTMDKGDERCWNAGKWIEIW